MLVVGRLAGTANIGRRVCARSSCLRIRGDGDGEGGGAGIATGSQEVEHALIPCILPPLLLIRRASCERLCCFAPFLVFSFFGCGPRHFCMACQ